MFDPITLAVGAGILAAGWATGRITKPNRRTPKPVKPLCSCTHPLSSHDPDSNTCHDTIEQATEWDELGDPVGYQRVPCPCRKYDGPRPIEEMFSQPLMLPEPYGQRGNQQ